MSGSRRRWLVVAAWLAVGPLIWGLTWRPDVGTDRAGPSADAPVASDEATLARGAYLARVGNCEGCHTPRGGAPFAGGRAIQTPFGIVFSSNLTPDEDTGLGRWTAADFWRAMHHGRSRDGRLLYPAFPYPDFTHVTRADSDAMHAWLLAAVPPVRSANRPHELPFPFGLQASLAVWRALYFRPGTIEPVAGRSLGWNRGRYLVHGLAHCLTCHGSRNALGAPQGATGPGGATVTAYHWYAPSLTASDEAGVADWSADDVVALLKTGVSRRGWAMGPMAEVVYRSTQHLGDHDLAAIAEYLRSLPAADVRAAIAPVAEPDVLAHGRKIYDDHCASCHGDQGEGRDGYLPLAGNRAVTLARPDNVIAAIRRGGFAPSTAGNPHPMGMPPFRGVLGDAEVAAVATYVRQSWGHRASAVGVLDVLRAP